MLVSSRDRMEIRNLGGVIPKLLADVSTKKTNSKKPIRDLKVTGKYHQNL
jgi:hypothetical protein